jgi:hypothetical protein
MARQRKHPSPRYFTTVADTAAEAEARNHELQQLAQPTGGRAVRVDRLREAMAIADQVPPIPQKDRRRTRGKSRNVHTPRRDARAAAMLRDCLAVRGDYLTEHNATRIIEQARTIVDRIRGISVGDRQVIEEARKILEQRCVISERDRKIVKQACGKIRQVGTTSPWDRDLVEKAQKIRGQPVH